MLTADDPQILMLEELLQRVKCVGDVTYPDADDVGLVGEWDQLYPYEGQIGGCLVWAADFWQSMVPRVLGDEQAKPT